MAIISFLIWLEKTLMYGLLSILLLLRPDVRSSLRQGLGDLLRPDPPSTAELWFAGVIAVIVCVGGFINFITDGDRR